MSSEDTLPEQAPVDEVIRYQEFGVRLREAREALGLSIMDVAEQLNLKVDVLNALESSNIDKLPAPTFTQGYIRAYARLLKLPADDILQGYNSAVPERQHPLVPNYGMPILAASEKSSFNIFIVLVVLLVIAAVSYFVIDVQSPPVSQESDLIEENSLSNAQSEQDQDSLINTDEIITNVPETNDQATESENVQLPESDVSTVDSKQSQPVEIEDVSQDVKTLPAEEKVVVQGEDLLEIVTSFASWAEVQDVNGARLIFELLDKGQTYQVKGKAPFSVFLGNAPAIKILVNSNNVDFSGYIRKNNIAHITVDNNGIARFNRRDKMIITSNDENTQHEASDATDPFANDLQ